MVFFRILFLLLSISSLAEGATYEIEYSYYGGLGQKMRKETAYRVEPSGKREAIQTRIYADANNELREASFLLKNGKWELYGDTNLPSGLKKQLDLVNKLATVKERSKAESGTSKEIEEDDLLEDNPNAQKEEEEDEQAIGAISCEMASPEYVICAGTIYRRDKTGSIQNILRSLKASSPMRLDNSPTEDGRARSSSSAE